MAQQQKPPLIPIDNFNQGGLADSKWSGVPHSLHKMIGWNVHQIPGIARVAQKMSNISGTSMNEFIKNTVASVNGHTYYFSAESGKVWIIRGDTGVIQLVYVTAPSLGEAKCLGAFEYQNFIYWFTEKKIHRIPSAVASTDVQWAANVIFDWAEFLNGDKEFHPVIEQNLVMYVGDGNILAQVDSGTFSQNALDIETPQRIKTLGKAFTDVLIGTFVGDNVTKTELIRWNTFSGSFQVSNQIDEIGVNAILQTDNFIYVQAGQWGRVYVYDYVNNRLESFKTIPGEYSPTATCTCNPDAVATINGVAIFGISNMSGDPCDEGVYAIGRHSRNYPYILDMPYPISERFAANEISSIQATAGIVVDDFVLSGVEIGSIVVAGFDVFVTWRRTYQVTIDSITTTQVKVGVDKLDYSNKLNGAYLQSRVATVMRMEMTNFDWYGVAYATLPTGCDIQILTSRNYHTFRQQTTKNDVDRNTIYADMNRLEATTLQMRLKVVTVGNLAPEIESSGIQVI